MFHSFHDKMKAKQGLTCLKILFNSWPGFSRATEILNRCCLERKLKIFKFYIYTKRGFNTILFIYTKNLTAPARNRTQGPRIYVSVLWSQSYWDTARTARNFHIYWIGHHSQFSNRKTFHLHNVEWSLSGDFLK